MAIGFDTPSKRQAEAMELNSPQNQMGDAVSVERAQQETYARLQQLGELICGQQFANLPSEHKQQLLMDFAYYKAVLDVL